MVLVGRASAQVETICHVSEMCIRDSPKENAWVGYVLTIDGTTYYMAGDTDQNKDTEQVRCDVALVPIRCV